MSSKILQVVNIFMALNMINYHSIINYKEMSQRQDEIKRKIELSGLSYAYFAKQLKMNRQNFHYHLNESPELDRDLYEKIIILLNKFLGNEIEDSDAQKLAGESAKGIDTINDFNNKIFRREYTVPILSSVPAGLAEISEYYDQSHITFDSSRQFALVVDSLNGDSMIPLLEPGDVVYCDTAAKPEPGNLVAARWGQNYGTVKIYRTVDNDPEKILLSAYNQSVAPILLNKNEVAIWKVIFIKKK